MPLSIKVLLVDDEPNNHEVMQSYLAEYDHINIVGNAFSTKDADYILQHQKVDLVFLDIKMPNQSGIDWLAAKESLNFSVVFVTAHDEYALPAIKLSALDYILKPIEKQAIVTVLNKFSEMRNREIASIKLDNLLKMIQNQHQFHTIALPTVKETYFINPSDIIYIESRNSYSIFHILHHSDIMISKSIKEYESLLASYNFIRVHQSYLVNAIHIVSIQNSEIMVLSNKQQIPISRNRKQMVINFLKR